MPCFIGAGGCAARDGDGGCGQDDGHERDRAAAHGTKYELHLSGPFTLNNGLGQSYVEDALYCHDDSGFASPQCSPTPVLMGDFRIGAGNSSLKSIGSYREPGGGGNPPGYSAIGLDRFSGAVRANQPAFAFEQEAFVKVNGGALATDLASVQRAAKAFGKKLNPQLSSARVKAAEARIAATEISNQLPGGVLPVARGR